MRVATDEVMEVLLAVLVRLRMREWLLAIYLQIASLRRGLEAQLTILERLETQRARDSRAMLANLVESPGSLWCGMLLLQKQQKQQKMLTMIMEIMRRDELSSPLRY
jgi:hypothetical protein